MSRNAEIEFVHKLTQDSFSVCRSLLKKYNWSSLDALTSEECVHKLANISRKTIDTFPKCVRQNLLNIRRLAVYIEILNSREKYDRSSSEVQDASSQS